MNQIEYGKNLGWSFSSGLAGYAWMILFLAKNAIIDPDLKSLLEEVDQILSKQLDEELSNGNVDQLNGAIGIGRYFLKRKNNSATEKIISYLD